MKTIIFGLLFSIALSFGAQAATVNSGTIKIESVKEKDKDKEKKSRKKKKKSCCEAEGEKKSCGEHNHSH
jgi:hypothetical protein